jgi:2',3'-cyclic-nucleotide 2'-phosphodiesterase (5'-nucleotidase family)
MNKIYSRIVVFFWSFIFLFFTDSCHTTSSLPKSNLAFNTVYEINKDLGQDSNIIKIIKPYKDSIDLYLNNIIGYSEQKMAKGYPEGLLGNFITDLAINTINSKYKINADFCIFNNGGLRSELPKGPVSLRNIYEIMPFENEVVILTITGETIDMLLDYFIKGENLSISGMNLQISQNKIEKAEIQGQPVDKSKSYKLITSDYLANGGDRMAFLKKAMSRQDTYIKLRDLIVDYIVDQNKLGNKLSSKLDGRIKVNP